MKVSGVALILAAGASFGAGAANLSPASWPEADRARVEQLEYEGRSPAGAKTFTTRDGIISATVSPIAVYAGQRALAEGGSAADAAATVALTQITTQLGSVVSYAGIISGLYYDASTRKVYSLDGGYNSYLEEDDPASIPIGDMGPLNFGRKPTVGGAKGRETLVPGFMAGLESMHQRFGRLPFAELFEPAIWYDEQGIRVSPSLDRYFKMRLTFLQRTPEGRAFLAQAGGTTPEIGKLFRQKALATTLRGVAKHGSQYMYTGEWGREFVATVRREGGKVTHADMERYEVSWDEPRQTEVFGYRVAVNGGPHFGAYNILPALNITEALELQARGPYWEDAETFRSLARINQLVTGAPELSPALRAFLAKQGIDASPGQQLGKQYARAIADRFGELTGAPDKNVPRHSNSIVVVDKDGNVAAITHTINSVVWGDTGIVVGGVPIPDSAAFQQERLVALGPGKRLQHEIIDAIAFKDDVPVLAIASIGSSLVPESLRTLFGVLGQHQDLATVMRAPPLLTLFDLSGGSQEKPANAPVMIPEGAYNADFLETLRTAGMVLTETPADTARALRGTLSAVAIDPETGERTAVDEPGVMVFNGVQ